MEHFQKVLKEKREACNLTFKELSGKLLSKKYMKSCPYLYCRYPEIYQSVERMEQKGLDPPHFHEQRITKFLRECIPEQLEKADEKTLSSFYKWLVVADIRKLLPDENYNDKKYKNGVAMYVDFGHMSQATLL